HLHQFLESFHCVFVLHTGGFRKFHGLLGSQVRLRAVVDVGQLSSHPARLPLDCTQLELGKGTRITGRYDTTDGELSSGNLSTGRADNLIAEGCVSYGSWIVVVDVDRKKCLPVSDNRFLQSHLHVLHGCVLVVIDEEHRNLKQSVKNTSDDD